MTLMLYELSLLFLTIIQIIIRIRIIYNFNLSKASFNSTYLEICIIYYISVPITITQRVITVNGCKRYSETGLVGLSILDRHELLGHA